MQVDWTRTYEVPAAFTALASEVHSSQPQVPHSRALPLLKVSVLCGLQVRIPLPFSSSWDPQRDGMKSSGQSSDDESSQQTPLLPHTTKYI